MSRARHCPRCHPRCVIALTAVLWLLAATVHATSAPAPVPVAEQLGRRLVPLYPENMPIVPVPMDAALLDMVVGTRIDARLLEHAPQMQGTGLEFTRPDPHHAAAIITLQYPTPAIARHQAARLAASGRRHFQHAKILTVFSHGVVDDTLVIVFTENRDERLVALIETFVRMLETAPGVNPPAP